MKKIIVSWMFSVSCFAMDIPGGILQSLSPVSVPDYELSLAPTLLPQSSQTYYVARLQILESNYTRYGLVFGTGEDGYHFGTELYHTLYSGGPDWMPEVVGFANGAFRRWVRLNSAVLRAGPELLWHVKTSIGLLQPMVALPFTQSFGLGFAPSEFSMKFSGGFAYTFSALNDVRVQLEYGLGLLKSFEEMVVSVTIPIND